jgi:Phage tail assembly chaperone protein
MVNEQSNVIPEPNLPPAEIRSEYYIADDEGFLKTTLLLTAEEVVNYTGLLTEKPPERESAGLVMVQLTPDEIDEIAWTRARKRRAELLAESDWVVTKAMDQGTPVPADWQAYRQALRDITSQTDPFNIVWPTKP